MRISVEKDIPALVSGLNKVLAQLGFDFCARVTVRAYSTSFPLTIASKLPKPVSDLQLTYLRNLTDDVAPTAGVFVDWIPDPNGIRIRNITGLTAAKNYELRFMLYA